MRALLLFNPSATMTTPAVTDVIVRALSADLKLDVEATKRRDHATVLAAEAAHGGYEVVIALGGDGTVNEVLQGVAGTAVRLALIPGGSTNVWARTLGLPNDAVEATSVVLRKLRDKEDRLVNLGIANDRYFAFCAGWGYDAVVVRMVEQRLMMKRAARQATFLWCGLLAYLRSCSADVWIRPSVDAAATDDAFRTVVCCNSDPYTFLGPLAVRLCPRADLERGLDLMGVSSLGFFKLARVVRRALAGEGVSRLGHVRLWHDQRSYELTATDGLPLHVDGEFVGETDRLSLRSVSHALSVIA